MTEPPTPPPPIENFEPSVHGPHMVRWAKGRGITGINPYALPETGWAIAGHCVGFLYLTNSNIAFLENLVANPELSRSQRDAALDRLVAHILATARELGVGGVIGMTSLDTVLARAQKHGFELYGEPRQYSLFMRVV